jgi:hypothetical protein
MLVRIQEKGILIHCWWECKLVQPVWKRTCMEDPQKTKNRAPV